MESTKINRVYNSLNGKTMKVLYKCKGNYTQYSKYLIFMLISS